MALDLLRLQSERENRKGFAFSKDDSMQKEFEANFAYQPTKDQLLVTSQIKEDMEQPHPMDRLLVGDVGFGKTEVAFRAIFKAILDQNKSCFYVQLLFCLINTTKLLCKDLSLFL